MMAGVFEQKYVMDPTTRWTRGIIINPLWPGVHNAPADRDLLDVPSRNALRRYG